MEQENVSETIRTHADTLVVEIISEFANEKQVTLKCFKTKNKLAFHVHMFMLVYELIGDNGRDVLRERGRRNKIKGKRLRGGDVAPSIKKRQRGERKKQRKRERASTRLFRLKIV